MKDKYSLNKVTWQYIIVDEGHRMKNYKSKFTQTLGTQFNSVYRLLLTGTPLQNNLSELWALLNFLLPKIFNSCEDFEKWFNQPFSSKLPGEKNTELTEEQELLIINRLHHILLPFLLRREKREVEKELPSKTEYVIKLQMSEWQKIVYKQIKEQGLLAEDPSTGRLGKKALMNTMMQLRKICNHPYLFIDYNNELLENITDWIYKSSGKFEFLDRIIPKLLYFKHKILIFSQMTQLLNILERYFLFKGIKCLRLDGATKSEERGRQIELFSDNTKDYMIFILSTRAGGLGLNLQAADTVIIFDSDWNPQMDIQAQDRAHRIGQKHEVKVFRLISKKTIEEGILEKAAFKKNMDEKVIRAGLYNSKYSESERRNKLMDILKNENKEEEEEDEILNDEQINEDIARTEEEFQKFQEMDKERYLREKKDEKLKEIKDKLDLNEEQLKTINYRLLQEFEVPEWVKISKENEKEYDKIEEVEIGGKEMRVRKLVNYKDDYDDDFLDDSISERSNLNKKRKKENSVSGIDSFELENRSNKKKKFGSESNSMRQSSQVDLSNYGDERSRNNNVNINLGSNKVQIKLNDDDDDEQDNTFKSDEKIHLDEDDEDEK
jgi:superfamily II DNA/RNA helicase